MILARMLSGLYLVLNISAIYQRISMQFGLGAFVGIGFGGELGDAGQGLIGEHRLELVLKYICFGFVSCMKNVFIF